MVKQLKNVAIIIEKKQKIREVIWMTINVCYTTSYTTVLAM